MCTAELSLECECQILAIVCVNVCTTMASAVIGLVSVGVRSGPDDACINYVLLGLLQYT